MTHLDPLRVVGVVMSDATPAEVRSGLIGYLTVELAGGLVIEGATLRRSRAGLRSVSFPQNRKGYPYLWLRTRSARLDLEHQVFQKLGIVEEATEARSHWPTNAPSGGRP